MKHRGFFAGLLAGLSPFLLAGVMLWSPVTGDLNFPGLTPTTINNMTIGATTPSTGAFTNLAASGTLSGTGFSGLFAAPGAIGGTTPAAGAFTTLSASGAVAGAGFTALFASPPAIGGTAAAAGSFTTLGSSGLGTFVSLKVDTGTKTAAATAGAATLAKNAGVITSEALTTAAGATYTLTLTNTTIAAADQVLASVGNGTNTAGRPAITTVTPGANSVVIVVQNIHAADALNGTITIAFVVYKN